MGNQCIEYLIFLMRVQCTLSDSRVKVQMHPETNFFSKELSYRLGSNLRHGVHMYLGPRVIGCKVGYN